MAVYPENRIIEAIFGKKIAAMEYYLYYANFKQGIEKQKIKPIVQVLAKNLNQCNPEVVFNATPYRKGLLFFKILEAVLGPDELIKFLRSYISEFNQTGVSTKQFEEFLKKYLLARGMNPVEIANLQLSQWLYEPGLPSAVSYPTDDVFADVKKAVELWLQGTPAQQLKTADWVSQQWLYFLQQLKQEKLSLGQMHELDTQFHFTTAANAKIAKEWFLLAIQNHYSQADDALVQFLHTYGAIGLIYPLYDKLKEVGRLDFAQKIYQQARVIYHPTLQHMLDALFNELQQKR